MNFVMLVVFLLWLVLWPIVSYVYVKSTMTTTPDHRTGPIRLRSGQVKTAPIIDGDDTLLMLSVGQEKYILDDRLTTDFLRRVKSTQMTVRTMNEVQALE